MKTYAQLLVFSVSFAFVSHLVYNYYKKNRVNKEIHDVIMFSESLSPLRKSKYSRCKVTESLDRLLYYLNTSRHTLDICMYVMTNGDIANVIMKLHYRGVRVRVIVDADMAFSSGSTIHKMEKQGIPVRWKKSTNLMHHKFCLVDTSVDSDDVVPLAVVGSLNWTNQGLNGNWEDVIVTSQMEIVGMYKKEFERLWVSFKPVV